MVKNDVKRKKRKKNTQQNVNKRKVILQKTSRKYDLSTGLYIHFLHFLRFRKKKRERKIYQSILRLRSVS